MASRNPTTVLAAAGLLGIAGGVLFFCGPSADHRRDLSPLPADSKSVRASSLSEASRRFGPASRAVKSALPHRPFRNEATALRARFQRLSKSDRSAAIDTALRLGSSKRNLALSVLASAWKNDPRHGYPQLAKIIASIVALNRVPSPQTTPSAQLLQALNNNPLFNDPSLSLLTMRLANRMLTDQDRSYILTEAAAVYAKIDPRTAFAFGSTLSGNHYEKFVEGFSEGWASQDPASAIDWASSIPDAEMRKRILASTIRTFSASSPDQAARWLDRLPAGESRQTAIHELGESWASQDTAAALAWAGQLSTPAERQQASAAIQSVAPVGVGIALGRMNATGYPVAMDIVPSGPAAQTGGIQRGDQIVAVTDGSNQWINTGDLPLEQIISRIRGTSGQPVRLRLLSPGATDLSQARTVTIVRQQVLFKRPSSGG